MRAILSCVAFLGLAIVAKEASANTMAFEDNKLNFTSCDGEAITARWRGKQLSLAAPGKSLGDAHDAFKFKSWTGACSTARWDLDRATFLINDGTKETQSPIVRYIAPDGAKWVAIRAGDGFFVTKIAAANEETTPDRVKQVAAWLARTSREFTPGAELAERLKAQSPE